MAKKKKVAILYGGRSVEHAVSVNSARNIYEYLDKTLFEPIPIGISKQGQWYLTSDVNKAIHKGKPLGLQSESLQSLLHFVSNGRTIKSRHNLPGTAWNGRRRWKHSGIDKGHGYSHGWNRCFRFLPFHEQDRCKAIIAGGRTSGDRFSYVSLRPKR